MITAQDVINEQYRGALDQRAPHVLMRPAVYPDGNIWCALYGENLQDGVAGFGKTPEAACADFDRNWWGQVAPTPTEQPPEGGR